MTRPTDPVVTGTGVALRGARCAGDLLAPVPDPFPETGPWPPHERQSRFKDRATRLALLAGAAALTDAGLLGDGRLTVPGTAVGTVVSSNLGTLETVCRVAGTLDREGPAGLRTMDLPNACSNATASSVAIRFGLRGVNLMLCNGATSGLDAVGWAALALAAGRARHVLVIGVEPADPVVRRLARGPVPLDGAAALVLETRAAAAGRGRRAGPAVAGYARRRDVAGAVAAATPRTARDDKVGLWLPPEEEAGGRGTRGDSGPPGLPAAAVLDLGRTLPPASGAFGAFQCVAATAWLAATATPPDTALAAAGGGPVDDAAAAVLLTTAPYDDAAQGDG
ncbi:beta-ketoacyl synthase N-terminal-like domain-containing protein [Streptomyces sp. NPDC046261]|uniref:beta-ketoacyl synthase N-terminal-like domain-containing protein n=1 Tax=Streptomyces sp. NPDC046261 TaxID=3157200 RepID=UPI0033D3A41A